MKLPPAAIGLLALVVTATCVTAGFWQLSRLHEKRVLNAQRRAALARPAAPLAATAPGRRAQAGHKVVAEGVYDHSRQVLLSARFHDGELGVEVLTPMFAASSGTLLVNRGWLPSEDGVHALPESLPDPGASRVVGILEPIPDHAPDAGWRRLTEGGAEHWSAHAVDSASVAQDVPYPLAPYVLVALPEAGAPESPVRSGPPLLDENMHLSYAIQWFAFALATAGGTLMLALRRRRAGAAGPPPGG